MKFKDDVMVWWTAITWNLFKMFWILTTFQGKRTKKMKEFPTDSFKQALFTSHCRNKNKTWSTWILNWSVKMTIIVPYLFKLVLSGKSLDLCIWIIDSQSVRPFSGISASVDNYLLKFYYCSTVSFFNGQPLLQRKWSFLAFVYCSYHNYDELWYTLHIVKKLFPCYVLNISSKYKKK